MAAPIPPSRPRPRNPTSISIPNVTTYRQLDPTRQRKITQPRTSPWTIAGHTRPIRPPKSTATADYTVSSNLTLWSSAMLPTCCTAPSRLRSSCAGEGFAVSFEESYPGTAPRRPNRRSRTRVASLDAAPLFQCQLSMPKACLLRARGPSSAFSNRHMGNVG
jgi:hypothetical protein